MNALALACFPMMSPRAVSRLAVLVSLVLVACADDPDTSGAAAVGGDIVSSQLCEPEQRVDRISRTHSAVLEVWPQDGALLVSHLRDDNRDFELHDSEGIRPLGSLPGGAGYTFHRAAFVWGDRRCIVFSRSRGSVQLACDDGTVESSGIEASSRLHPVAAPDGSIHVFTQGRFASYTELIRTRSGWREERKNESSISSALGAVLHDGWPVSCFVNMHGRVVLDGWYSTLSSAERTGMCHLASTTSGLHVLTDQGYAHLEVPDFDPMNIYAPTGSLRFDETPVELNGRLLRVAALDDAPVAVLIVEGQLLELRTLPGLQLRTSIAVPTGSTFAAFDVDPAQGVGWLVTTRPEGDTMEIHTTKVCLDSEEGHLDE